MLKSVKESAYLTMVRPQLEYASDVWDPQHVGDIMELEKVQRRAAPLVLNDYGQFSSVSSMLNQLSWLTLQSRCKLSRLYTLHKVFYHQLFLSKVHTIYQQYDLQDDIIHYTTSYLVHL